MAFITNGAGDVISFAEYTDVVQKDQRIFESNNLKIPAESGFNTIQEFIEDQLEKSTQRILLKLKASTWWTNYLSYVGQGVMNPNVIPNVNPNLIDPGNALGRRQQFTDMCVYYNFAQYLFPLIAEFGNDESPEVQKIQYYDAKFNDIFNELISIADWYDADNDGIVEADEQAVSYMRTRRSRSRRSVVPVR
jgi:hypothetical protein